MKVKIEIDTKTFVRFWLVVIAFAFAILAIYSASAALILIGIAFFLALALNAPVSFFGQVFTGQEPRRRYGDCVYPCRCTFGGSSIFGDSSYRTADR